MLQKQNRVVLVAALSLLAGGGCGQEEYVDPYAKFEGHSSAPAQGASSATGGTSGPEAAGVSAAAGGAGPAAAPDAPPPGGDPAQLANQVKLTGQLIPPKNAPAGAIQIDVNATGGTTGAGPVAMERLQKPGAFSLYVPKGAGSVNFVIYVGVTGSDPGKVGPQNMFSWGPVEVGDEDITGLTVDLSAPTVQPGTGGSGGPMAGSAGSGTGGAPGMMPGGAAVPGVNPVPGSMSVPGVNPMSGGSGPTAGSKPDGSVNATAGAQPGGSASPTAGPNPGGSLNATAGAQPGGSASSPATAGQGTGHTRALPPFATLPNPSGPGSTGGAGGR